MNRPNRHQRLQNLSGFPAIKNLRELYWEAEKARGVLFELPWMLEKSQENFSLTVQFDFVSSEPIWTLYQGQGDASRVMWSSPFTDIDLLMDVIRLSIPSANERAEIPSELAPGTKSGAAPLQSTGSREPEASHAIPQGYYPYPAPIPPGYMPPYPPGYVPYPAVPPGYIYPYQYPTYPPGFDPASQQSYPQPGYAVQPATPSQSGTLPSSAPVSSPAGPANQQLSPISESAPIPPAPTPEVIPKAVTLPVSPAVLPPPPQIDSRMPAVKPQSEPLPKKKPNILLGNFLVQAGLFPEPTLDAALRMQDLVKSGALSNSQAAEAVKRAHQRGGALDPAFEQKILKKDLAELKRLGPPLGQILVEAGLITIPILKESLQLQKLIRSGAMTQEEACQQLQSEHLSSPASVDKLDQDSPRINRVIRLLMKVGIITNQDLISARNTRFKSGGKVSRILIDFDKVDRHTFEAAEECEVLFSAEEIDLEQATRALRKCRETGMGFGAVAQDMGFPGS